MKHQGGEQKGIVLRVIARAGVAARNIPKKTEITSWYKEKEESTEESVSR